MNESRNILVSLLAEEYKSIDDTQNLPRDLFIGTIETILGTKPDEHPGEG